MTRILVVHYSQSGQLDEVVRAFTGPLVDAPGIEVVFEAIAPEAPYPFPWPLLRFLDAFPESVYEVPPAMRRSPLEDIRDPAARRFDLVILAYQVWFLSPSLPVTGFLASQLAAEVLRDTPVITLIACRNMWLMAQEKVKQRLASLGATLCDNVALVDAAGGALSFVATPWWVLTGNKGPYLGGRIPAAGVAPDEIAATARFGRRIVACAARGEISARTPLLAGLGAVKIDSRLIASERIAHRSFRAWGALIRALGPPGAFARRPALAIYLLFLLTMIVTVVPVSALVTMLLSPLSRARIDRLRAHYAAPSGEACYGDAAMGLEAQR